MEPIFLSLISGLSGSIFGAYVTTRIYKSAKKNEAINNMLSLVHSIGFHSQHSKDIGQPSLIFHDKYSELWIAYTALINTVPLWKKRGLT